MLFVVVCVLVCLFVFVRGCVVAVCVVFVCVVRVCVLLC